MRREIQGLSKQLVELKSLISSGADTRAVPAAVTGEFDDAFKTVDSKESFSNLMDELLDENYASSLVCFCHLSYIDFSVF